MTDRELLARIAASPGQKAGYKQLVRELSLPGGRARRLLLEQLARLTVRGQLIQPDREHWSLPRPVSRPVARDNLVDGRLEDRHVGLYDHQVIQLAVQNWFFDQREEWNIRVVPSQRTRLGATKVRVPDVSVFSRDIPIEQVFTRPQLIAVEVLSSEDQRFQMDAKIKDYMQFGIRSIGVIDSVTREGWNCSQGNWISTERFEVPGTPIFLSLPDLFTKMDADGL